MKDRFIKVMLVIIAVLLLLNCFKDNGGISDVFGMKVGATVPTFIQKNKIYDCDSTGKITVLEIDKDGGWVLVKGGFGYNVEFTKWVNLTGLRTCEEAKPK